MIDVLTATAKKLVRVILRPQPQERIEELAKEIIGFARMRSINGAAVLIEVPQVAFHLRETNRHIRQSLCHLETQGTAAHTPSPDHWKLWI